MVGSLAQGRAHWLRPVGTPANECMVRVRNENDARCTPPLRYNRALRSRNALPITDTELKLIASAAISGDSSQPVNGYSTPAARGIPSAL